MIDDFSLLWEALQPHFGTLLDPRVYPTMEFCLTPVMYLALLTCSGWVESSVDFLLPLNLEVG